MTKQLKILVIEDEESIRELIRYNLQREGWRVVDVRTGEEGLASLRSISTDIILLDLMLPGLDGLEVCRRLKRDPATAGIPVVMLTARGEESDVVAGLELGADDYVTKPFSPKVLVARIKAVLRRRQEPEAIRGELIRTGRVVIHRGKREVRVDDNPVDLTFSEFELLSLLASRPGWVFTRDRIVEAVRGDDYHVTDRAVDVQVVGLRRKLGAAGSLIETVRGVGYRFRE
jgi:two-component system phosphate regulon response regulator PhoB